jgi:hypothetical protein
MLAVTKSQACDWCVAHNIVLNERHLPQPDFTDERGQDFKIPADTGRRIALLSQLFRSIPANQEILLWFSEWGVWPSNERPHMFERFRASYGENRSLSDAPAFIFNPAEREDLVSFTGFAILFLWDCHLLTATGDTWLYLSHDEIGWIWSNKTSV